jgi:hypothetical protein
MKIPCNQHVFNTREHFIHAAEIIHGLYVQTHRTIVIGMPPCVFVGNDTVTILRKMLC